jgi:hypothetical protein
MKVFLSWSGIRSKTAAEFLADWVRDVIQTVNTWMSKKDIDAGRRWDNQIATELDGANFGIVCITPENRQAPWLMFEAGALAKRLGEGQVVPYLIDMEPEGIGATPLASFQAKTASKEGTWDLVRALNKAHRESPLAPDHLKRAFDANWPRLDALLRGLPPAPAGTPEAPRPDEMLKEILLTVRGLGTQLDVALAHQVSERALALGTMPHTVRA